VTGEEGEAKAGSDQAADRGGISAGMATTSLGREPSLPESASETNPWMRKDGSRQQKDCRRSHPRDCSHSSRQPSRDLRKGRDLRKRKGRQKVR
jgi:hypothetical protein